jgi:hypothetical protein
MGDAGLNAELPPYLDGIFDGGRDVVRDVGFLVTVLLSPPVFVLFADELATWVSVVLAQVKGIHAAHAAMDYRVRGEWSSSSLQSTSPSIALEESSKITRNSSSFTATTVSQLNIRPDGSVVQLHCTANRWTAPGLTALRTAARRKLEEVDRCLVSAFLVEEN